MRQSNQIVQPTASSPWIPQRVIVFLAISLGVLTMIGFFLLTQSPILFDSNGVDPQTAGVVSIWVGVCGSIFVLSLFSIVFKSD